eukprot:scaffold20920_cov56-Cyclotella_meneghiniana.AAC.2
MLVPVQIDKTRLALRLAGFGGDRVGGDRIGSGRTMIWVKNGDKNTWKETTEHKNDFNAAYANGDVIDVSISNVKTNFVTRSVRGVKHYDSATETHYMKIELISQK